MPHLILDILEEHLEEVGFLSIQRRKLLFSPEVPLTAFQQHEERISAHWDGLTVGGGTSVELAVERFEEFDPWEVYAAARVWLELGDPETDDLVELLETTDAERIPAWREALRRSDPHLVGHLFPPDRTISTHPAVQSVVAFAWGWHGMLPDDVAATLTFSPEPSVRWSVARGLGWGAAPTGAPSLLEALLSDPEPEVRDAAAWGGVLLDPDRAVGRARESLTEGGGGFFAARILGLLGRPQDASVLIELVGPDVRGVACVRALGDLGRVSAIGPLVDLAGGNEETLVRPAREAIETILGDGAEGVMERDEWDAEVFKKEWESQVSAYEGAEQWLRGRPYPWVGPPDEEPMESIWRRGLVAASGETQWLRREVPDGFFDPDGTDEAVPGL